MIVGRPNVGKSTLFNAIIGDRRSIVGDEPGITRDRIYGEAQYGAKRFGVIDTGGIVPDDDALIPTEILKQARVALEIASHIVFVIDGRTEITSSDRDLAKLLRPLNKPITLAVNKIDATVRENLVHEFYSLGLGDPVGISAEHRRGIERAARTPLPLRFLNPSPKSRKRKARKNSAASKWRSSAAPTWANPPC